MSKLNDRIQALSEVEIRRAFDEIMAYNKQGSMGDTLVRQIRNEFAKEINVDSWDRNCAFTCGEIMEEITKRLHLHYGIS